MRSTLGKDGYICLWEAVGVPSIEDLRRVRIVM